jgi:hypothetical protein
MKDNMDYEIEKFAKTHSELLKAHWGRDGKTLLASIALHAGILEEQATTHHFEAFWAAYPAGKRKVNKAGCLTIWRRYRLDDLLNDIIRALDAAKADEDWVKQAGAFVPMPSVWLGQRRWEALLQPKTNDIFSMLRNK